MRKLQLITIFATLALAIPFIAHTLFEIVYLVDYARSIGGAIAGFVEWTSVAREGAVRWPELAGMIIGQLFLLGLLLTLRHRRQDNRPELFGEDTISSDSKRTPRDKADLSKHS
ncbi:MAG TPA: hypothetical protein VMP08_10280 [Anaerolineae bacterium]|nr:hypothetical protein [Anaerolineae bacterium]